MSPLKSVFEGVDCNGKGIRLGGSCICDLGFRGSNCALTYDMTRPAGTVRELSVLLVVENFSPIDVERDNAIYYTTLAGFLARSGYTVTVLLTGPPTTNFDQLKKLYGGKKIELTRLLPAMRFENSLVAEISYRVMRWIVDESQVRRGPWEMIFMLGGKGVGYYTLLAQRQGLLCIGSHIVVGLDGLSPLRRDQFRKGSKNALVTEEESLAGDFLQQRSTEMADTVIASSKALLDYALESGWRVPEHTYILPYLTVPVANEKSEIERAEELIPARQTQVKEFVFIGPLGTVGGLSVFLNAIDNVLSRDQKAHRKILKERQVKVTFYGWNDVTGDDGDITGEQYIEMRSYAWGNRVKWTVNSELHLKKLVKYMTEPGKGRVAVLPAIGDSSGFVLHQALRAGVPVMASNLKSSQELVHIQDRRDVLFAANDTVALAKRMIDVFNNGVLLGRPQVAIRQYEAQWRQLLADVHARPLGGCPCDGFKLPPHKDDVAPLVSIVITHYNRYRLLQQAIESIERQTYKNFEVILVDDGSTDPEAIKFLSELSWRWWQERAWRVLREPNRYLGAARNTGAKHARGKYVLFMDDDDVAKPVQVEMMARIAEITGADVVTTGHDLFAGRQFPNPRSLVARYVPLGPAMNSGILRNVFGDSAMFIHRQFFLDLGGFTEEYGVGFEDYELLAKVVTRDNHLEPAAEPLHWYRRHGDTMSTVTDLKAGQVRFLRAYLDVFAYLPRLTQGLLRYVQNAFFEIESGPMLKYALANTTTTTTSIKTVTSTSFITMTSTKTSITVTTASTITETMPTGTDSVTITMTFTSTPSMMTFQTSLITPGGTCPCRSHRKSTQSLPRSTRSTCFSTATVHQTIKRTAKVTTLTVTYTPSITCDAGGGNSTTASVKALLDGAGLFQDQPMTVVFTDAPPARAPIAIQAEYAPRGEFVSVVFDRPVNVEVGRRFRCDTFLVMQPRNVPNGAMLGAKPEDCLLHFASPTEMRVVVDGRYTRRTRDALQPGRLLVFREGTISNVDTLNRAFVSGAIEVASPADPDPPIIIVDAPSVIGGCDEYIRVDLSKSAGSASRPFIDAHFDFNSTAVENHFLDAPLRQYLHAAAKDVLRTGRMVFDIPASLLTEFTAYTLELSLWNVFGVGGTGYATISRVASPAVPAVYLEGPKYRGADEALQLSALLPGTVCGKPYNSTLAWSILSGPKRVRIRGSNRPVVVFAANTLEPGDYVVGLRVTVILDDGDDEEKPSTYVFTHEFTILPAKVQLEIIGGSRLIGFEDSTRLVLRTLGARLEEFAFKWVCLGTDRETPCTKRTGEEWPDSTEALAQVLIVNGRQWEPMSDMEFSVTATHKTIGYSVKDSVVIAVARFPSVPRVELAVDKVSVTTQEGPLNLMAAVARPRDPDQPRNYTYNWESLPYCNHQAYATTSSVVRNLDWTEAKNDQVQVMPVSLMPGTEYCIRVAVTNSEGVAGWAFRIIKVKEPPSGGYCELMSAPAGVAFEHRFTVACHGWSGPNIRYRFKARVRGDPIPLGPASSTSQISFTADVGHYFLEVDILDGDGLVTTVPVRAISARHGDFSKDAFVSQALGRFEKSRNPRLGYEILALTAANLVPSILAGQAPHRPAALDGLMMAARTPNSEPTSRGNVTLTRILSVIDQLTVSQHIDATESGPYFLEYLQRILPNKLPIDLRPMLLRIINRITAGMASDPSNQAGCFAPQYVIQILRLLGPIYENPRGGSSASFTVHEIKNVLENCIQRTMYCEVGDPKSMAARRVKLTTDDEPSEVPLAFTEDLEFDRPETNSGSIGEWDGEPFLWSGGKQAVEFGLVDTRDVAKVAHLCGFNLPDLQGMATAGQPCLGYRCALTQANLMRNSSIDSIVVELAFRNATQVLAPWFRTRHLTFLLPLSPDFRQRVKNGGKPKCVWYDRYANATSSAWSDEGCRVLGFNMTHVQCACSHLTEFAIMVRDIRKSIGPPIGIILLIVGLFLASCGVGWLIYMRKRKGTIDHKRTGSHSTELPIERSSFSQSTLRASDSASTLAPHDGLFRRTRSNLWDRGDEEALRRERLCNILRETRDEL